MSVRIVYSRRSVLGKSFPVHIYAIFPLILNDYTVSSNSQMWLFDFTLIWKCTVSGHVFVFLFFSFVFPSGLNDRSNESFISNPETAGL